MRGAASLPLLSAESYACIPKSSACPVFDIVTDLITKYSKFGLGALIIDQWPVRVCETPVPILGINADGNKPVLTLHAPFPFSPPLLPYWFQEFRDAPGHKKESK